MYIEVKFNPQANMKAGKKTNQIIQTFESAKITAINLRIATKTDVQLSEYLVEWSGTLELPLTRMVTAEAARRGSGQHRVEQLPRKVFRATSASSQDAPPQATGSMASTSADAVLVEDSPTDTVPRIDGAGGIYGSPSRRCDGRKQSFLSGSFRRTRGVLTSWTLTETNVLASNA